ncbi:MAG: oligosaccharide flippase family protein [Flavobacterium sp.]|uniref:oligosaccharide flippase family protein n=1 Tax=Flavobacterium sp. TaxID=239 RepID=UPI001B49C57D|nr:oligosaccharide flippase family protein [Flavobacterium sp.]MBP7183200.1 oligosaccharide flippase family protein [Flavobacterium sp.]
MEINSKKRISINIISTILQVLVVGVVYLFLYKFLLESLGIEKLGVWSIILATSSIANLANFGITSGLVKFIADYNAKKNLKDIPKLIFTALVSIIILFLLIVIIIYFFSKVILGFVVEQKYLSLALEILPYSLLCLFINSVGGIFTSTLEGFQKNYVKNFLFLFSSVFLLLSSYYLVPIYQLKGVAIAQVLQSVIILVGSLLFVINTSQLAIFNKWNWDYKIFRELINYGAKFQVISVFQMLYEPITKGLISKFGGLAVLGYYEMAARLVNQVRALIVNANQVMVPVVAHTNSTQKENLKELYNKMMSITFFVNVLLISVLLIFTPIISILWIGHWEPIFVFSMLLLSTSIFVNILIGPAYFSCVGEGNLNLILKSQIMIGILNLILGYVLGYYFSGKGVIVSWAISVAISSFYLFYNYQKEKDIPLTNLFTKYNVILFFVSVLVTIFSFVLYNVFASYINNTWVLLGCYIIVTIVVFIPFIIKNKDVIDLKQAFFKK